MHNTLRLVTLLAWGLYIPAYAQAPTFSIPAIPGTGSNSPSPPPVAAPQNPTNNYSAPPVLPGLEKITNSANEKKEETAETKVLTEEEKKEALKPGQTIPIATGATNDITNPAPPTTGLSPYTVAAPPLTLDKPAPEPTGVTAPPPLFNLPAPPQAMNLAVTAIPETKLEAKKTTPTWKDVLKPSYKPVETNFNFRRQVLPPAIYRSQYSGANRHLPLARNNQQYDHYFILAVARNDINAIRAMLGNGHRNVNLTNAEGDPVLIVAIRHNAIAAARLLLARGANPNAPGQNGWSAYDYARQIGDPELMAALSGGVS